MGAAPQRGSLRLRDPGQYYYTAPKNYVGPDRFALRICGSKDGTPGCVNIVYNMTIVPAR